MSARPQHIYAEEPERQQQTGNRSGDRHPEFRTGIRRFFRHFCDTAKNEQGDAAHFNAALARDEGMAELVKDDRGKQSQGAAAAHGPTDSCGRAWKNHWENAHRKRPGDEHGNNDPA